MKIKFKYPKVLNKEYYICYGVKEGEYLVSNSNGGYSKVIGTMFLIYNGGWEWFPAEAFVPYKEEE